MSYILQVELLWRRTVGDKSGSVYCLMHVDLLSYDVSDEAEISLQQITKDNHGKVLITYLHAQTYF